MASLPGPSPAALVVSPHLTPLIHTFSTPELAAILQRSNLPSVSALLSAFETGVERVTVRSSNYEPRLLPRFSVHFVERTLPTGWGEDVGGGTIMSQRARSGTVGSNKGGAGAGGVLPHMPSGLERITSPAKPTPTFATPATPSTSFSWPTQAERDELFLDSLSSLITSRVDGWIAQTGREELDVRGVKPKRRLPEEGEEAEPEVEIDEGWKGRTVEGLTPWYGSMRDEVLKRREMVEWETFAWPVGCLLALSTSHPDPLNALSALWDLTSRENLFSPFSYPPRSGAEEDGRREWANPDILRYVVLVHDFGAGGGRDGWEDAQNLHDTIRKTYGLHTALLPLFSAAPTAAIPQPRARGVAALWADGGLSRSHPVVPRPIIGLGVSESEEEQVKVEPEEKGGEPIEKGHDLSDDDLKALRVFMREMVVQSIVPWIERSVVVGNEQYTASKRSIGGRLFSAGRKYFGGSNSGSRSSSPVSAAGSPLGYNAIKGFYPYLAQESQTRRLADLAFTIGDYKLAASIYEQASKDYRTDRAWRYYASACRMAGLSQLLMHPPLTPLNFNPDVWLEQALQTPLGSGAAGVDLDGLQAMMLYYEAYRAIGDWRAAPVGLVRTAGEADEVSSALLLEQAAIADLNLPKTSRRKYAFHMSMAAARYEKSGLKSLSRRCLSQAASIYRIEPTLSDDPRYPSTVAGWTAIRSHLHHGLGRQAYNVGKAGDAVEHFLELLVGAGVQSDEAVGEEDWLDDFGLAWEHLGPEAHRVVAERNLALPTTIFAAKDAHVRIPQIGNITAAEAGGEEWSRLEMEFVEHGFPGEKKPPSLSMANMGNEAVVEETFYLELRAVNPLDAALAIGGLQIETDAEPGTVEIEAPQEIELAPREALRIYVPVRATTLVSFTFTRLSFRFNDLLPCTETLTGKRKRLNATREQLTLATYAQDSSLLVNVGSPVPILSIAHDELPDILYAGEGRSSSITITNTGQVPLVDLRGLCSHPSFALFTTDDDATQLYASSNDTTSSSTIPNRFLPNTPSTIPFPHSTTSLEPGASIKIAVLCRGDAIGEQTLRWLFTFRGVESTELLTSRALHKLEVCQSLDIRPFVRPSNSPSSPQLLGIEVYNNSIPADVVITQISSLSPRWRCEMLPGFDFDEDIGAVGWQQSSNLFLAVELVEPSPDGPRLEEGPEFAVRKLDALLQGKDVTTSVPGDIVLQHSTISSPSTSASIDICAPPLLTSILRTHIALGHSSISTQLPTVSPKLHRHLFPLFNSRSLDLLVFWTVPSTGISGHHHLADIPFGAGANMLKQVLRTAELKAGGLYAESQRERSTLLAGLRRSEFGVDENPVAVAVEVDEVLEHDFESGPCSLAVSLYIRNLSPTLPFTYTLAFQPSDTPSSPSLFVVYAGALTRSGTAGPLSLTKFSTQLWISRQGTYDVGGWRLSATTQGGTWVLRGSKQDVRVRDVSTPRGAGAVKGASLVDVGA